MSIKENLTGEQFVQGNLKTALQVYRIFYYPPEENYPSSKLWLYFDRKQEGKYLGIKSLCFNNIENHRNFILNNIFCELYWLEKEGIEFKPETMDIHTFREKLLDALFIDLKKKIIKRLEKEIKNVH